MCDLICLSQHCTHALYCTVPACLCLRARAGILIEDQVWPKSCGHVKGKRVTSREEAVSRIRAAADAR